MNRVGLAIALCGGLIALSPASQAGSGFVPHATAEGSALLAQWPGPQGAPPGYAPDRGGLREHCWRMRERLREVRYRAESSPGWERERLWGRVRELRERLRYECRGLWRDDE